MNTKEKIIVEIEALPESSLSVESIRYQILRHHQKIADEEKNLTPYHNLINYCRKEIMGLEKSIAQAEKRLKRGK